MVLPPTYTTAEHVSKAALWYSVKDIKHKRIAIIVPKAYLLYTPGAQAPHVTLTSTVFMIPLSPRPCIGNISS